MRNRQDEHYEIILDKNGTGCYENQRTGRIIQLNEKDVDKFINTIETLREQILSYKPHPKTAMFDMQNDDTISIFGVTLDWNFEPNPIEKKVLDAIKKLCKL